ncbi:YceI family protein [Candidatus Peregrinibacteria bacterium]|nr:YceI family protein [Candidatus Peregrinibacteria bacterium]
MLKRVALLGFMAITLVGCAAKTPVSSEKPITKAEPISATVSGAFQVDPVASVVRWSGKKILVPTKHTGTISVTEGELVLEKGALKSGSFTLDMATIADEDQKPGMKEKLEGHLKSADFFDVVKFPTAALVIESAKALEGNEYQLSGKLTIKGVTQPVEFKATATLEGRILKTHATIEIDRTLWNVKYGSGKFFEGLGDKVIDDKIGFDISLVANPK